ncbi:MAG: acetyltransferase component of pyruvate dehydrogenase complex [Melioribacteraceae bacterium]|nr:MAG: acetyltransferase component of pyruvate dehydrogenase complex [Melioribacteraceae bacterium]
MLKEFKLPELGENIESADVTNVLVKVGDTIELDQPVVEIETDKASVEVPSEVAGTVKEVKVKEGENVAVGSVLITVESEGSSAPAKEEKKEKSKPAAKTEDKKVEAEPVKTEAKPQPKSSGLVEFRLPELGENIESADITRILVSVGDEIKLDQGVVEIETDKASVEVPSEVEGTVKEVKVKEGESAKVGDVLIVVDGSGSAPAPKTEEEKPAPAKEEAPKKPETPKTSPSPRSENQRAGEPPVDPARPNIPHRSDMPKKIAPAAPSVRRFAREIGIDINEVSGSGPGGRININDVKRYAKNLNESIRKGGVSAGTPIGIKKEQLPDFTKWGDIDVQPMSNVRKKTAEHLSYAWATIPHVTQFDKADITELEKMRKAFGKKAEAAGGKLTVTAILLKVIAGALKKFPQFNSSIDMDKKEVIYKKYINIGLAVDTDRGLLVPVIKEVDKKNIIELAVELSEISAKARDKKLTIDDMQGGNFSISNLGGIGGTSFTPIVNAPEVAILGVSRGGFEPVWIDGEFQPRLMLPLSLSYDHRIIDGADAARFIRWVSEALENPFILSLEG